jgi:CheY-like chemotaxis protein
MVARVTQPGDRPSRTIRVLLVEDNPHVAELITDGLDGAAQRDLEGQVAFIFDVVGDGQVALERACEVDPDLIILDVYMPVMDGAMFLRFLRARPRHARTPVIALSAGGPAARDAAMSAGADVFLDKPLRLSELLAAVVRLLSRSRAPST